MKKFLLVGFTLTSFAAFSQNRLPIPDTLSGNRFNLNMHKDSVQFLPGSKTNTLSFNRANYLGPTLILNNGDSAFISVNNQIGDTTTVHWHGLHVPAKSDGGPHTIILNNQTWNTSFKVMNDAATYWYHPHTHQKTTEQAMKGAAGLIIVRDSLEASIKLPRTYGVDDIPLIFQTHCYDSLNQIIPKSMQDSIFLVNGVHNPYVELPAQIVRLRMLNASQERTYLFGFSDSTQFQIIASDGGLLSAPFPTRRLRLSPGERAEILVDLSQKLGSSIYLKTYNSELPVDVQGSLMNMPGMQMPRNPINGIDTSILKIDVVRATSNPVTSIPSSLVSRSRIPASSAKLNRTINITVDSANMMSMDGPFYFNGQMFDMMRIDFVIPVEQLETWTISNQTMVAHPIHVHDIQFQVLDRDGITPPPNEQGWKDVVLVQSNETVRIIGRFSDFADTITPYMYHCHILMHEDDGMMGQFLVVPNHVATKTLTTDEIKLYNHPSSQQIQFSTPAFGELSYLLYDESGKVIRKAKIASSANQIHEIDQIAGGQYVLLIYQNGKFTSTKIIVNP